MKPLMKKLLSLIFSLMFAATLFGREYQEGDVIYASPFGSRVISTGNSKKDQSLIEAAKKDDLAGSIKAYKMSKNFSVDELEKAHKAISAQQEAFLENEHVKLRKEWERAASLGTPWSEHKKISEMAAIQAQYDYMTIQNNKVYKLLTADLQDRSTGVIVAAQKATQDEETSRLMNEMVDQAKSAGKIDLDEVRQINFGNIFFNKIAGMIPQKEISIVKGLSIKSPVFMEPPVLNKGESGFVVSGSVLYKGAETKIFVTVVKNAKLPDETRGWGVSVGIEAPDSWNFSDNYPALKMLDKLGIFAPRIIYSNFSYDTGEIGTVAPGLNFVARLNASGPMERFQTFVKNYAPYVVTEAQTLTLSGVITPDIVSSKFTARLPLYLGVDFNELHRSGKMKHKPIFLSRITTDALTVDVKPKDLTTTVSSGVILTLVSQNAAIKLNAGVGYNPPEAWDFYGEINGIWDPAFGQSWLALGDMGFDFSLDPAVTAAFALLAIPMPISGLGARGTFAFGNPGDKRVTTTVAGKIKFNLPDSPDAKIVPTFILKGELSKASFSDAVKLLDRMTKNKMGLGNLPDFDLRDLAFTIAPTGGSVGSQSYPQGLFVRAGMNLGNIAKGGLTFTISNESKTIEGAGYINEIKNDYFILTGLGADKKKGTEDDGPVVSLKLSPWEQSFLVSGDLHIPLLGLRGALTGSIDKEGFFFSTDGGVFFETLVGKTDIRIPFTSFSNMLVSFELASTMQSSLKELVRKEIKVIGNKLEKSSRDIQQSLKDEIAEDNAALKKLEKKLENAKEDCKKSIKHVRLSAIGDCYEAAVRKIKAEMKEVEISLDKAAKKLVKYGEKGGELFLKGVEILANVGSAIEIREISGTVTGADLKQGLLPRVTLVVQTDLFGKKKTHQLRDIQFDLKDPVKSAKEIADALIKFVAGESDADISEYEAQKMAEETLQTVSRTLDNLFKNRSR